MTTPPTTFDTFDYAAVKPRTDEEKMALLDAMLDELREHERRAEARKIESHETRRTFELLKAQTKETLAKLKEEMQYHAR